MKSPYEYATQLLQAYEGVKDDAYHAFLNMIRSDRQVGMSHAWCVEVTANIWTL